MNKYVYRVVVTITTLLAGYCAGILAFRFFLLLLKFYYELF